MSFRPFDKSRSPHFQPMVKNKDFQGRDNQRKGVGKNLEEDTKPELVDKDRE